MKILYFRTLYWFNLKAGGSIGHTAGVINSLSKVVDLEIVSNDILAEVQPKVEIVRPFFIPLLPKNISELFYNLKVLKFCGDKKVDAVYQRYNGFSFCGAYFAKSRNIPLILEYNSSDVWTTKYWKQDGGFFMNAAKALYDRLLKIPIIRIVENYNIRNAALIVVVSDVLKNNITKAGVDPGRILVNPNGVDPEKYSPNVDGSEIIARYGLDRKTVLGFIGTFGQWHGTENIVRAYGEFLHDYPDQREKTRLLMVGDGVRMRATRQIVEEYGMEDCILFTGLVPQDEGAKHLAACDILINATVPSPDGSEFFGSPTKVFEYMAMGKAVICSAAGQMARILTHKKNAYLVRPGDVRELADSFRILIKDRNLRDKLGAAARTEVAQKYTWDKHVDLTLQSLQALIDKENI